MVDLARARRVDEGVRLGGGLRTLAEGLDHPEAVCWSPAAACLYAGGEAGQLYRIPPGGGEAEIAASVEGAFLVGIACDGDGDVYACDVKAGCVWRIPPGCAATRYGDPIPYPNFPAFAADGRLFVSDSGSWEEATGGVAVLHPNGRTERLALRPLGFANGLAVRDGYLYVAESSAPAIVRVPLEGGEAETVCELTAEIPDGLAFDGEGGLWISCWQPNRVLRLAPSGELEVVLDDWTGIHLLTPTNVAFFGDSLEMLAIASLCGWCVSAFDPGVRGAPLNYPSLPR